jgi:hypothetical protein
MNSPSLSQRWLMIAGAFVALRAVLVAWVESSRVYVSSVEWWGLDWCTLGALMMSAWCSWLPSALRWFAGCLWRWRARLAWGAAIVCVLLVVGWFVLAVRDRIAARERAAREKALPFDPDAYLKAKGWVAPDDGKWPGKPVKK